MKNPRMLVGQDLVIDSSRNHVHGCSILYSDANTREETILIECTRVGYKIRTFLLVHSLNGESYSVVRPEKEMPRSVRIRRGRRGRADPTYFA